MKTSSILDTYQTWLTHREYSPATIQKYTKALARFFADTGAGDIPTRETVAAWRDSLTEKGYTPATVNAMLAAVNDCQESIDNVAGNLLQTRRRRAPISFGPRVNAPACAWNSATSPPICAERSSRRKTVCRRCP